MRIENVDISSNGVFVESESCSIKGFVDYVASLVDAVEIADPTRIYERKWEKHDRLHRCK